MRKLLLSALLGVLALVAGCGGGGGGAPTPAVNPPPPPPSSNTIASTGPNVQPISVNAGPANTVNTVFTSVTICNPGSTTICQTIDNVLIDTGSSGLRILSSVLPGSFSASLPPQTDATGNPVAECFQFATGTTWGPVKMADVVMASERAGNVPIQVIDPNFLSIPVSCTGLAANTVLTLHTNGVLGVGVFRQDHGLYYVCPAAGCQQTAQPLTRQVQNPVSMFATDNNGVIIELPSVAAAGAASVSGSLVFGIGTRANNGLGTATIFTADPLTGNITTLYNNQTDNRSFIDSGSNGLFFQDPSIALCTNASTAGFYCPPATLNLSAYIGGTNGTTALVNFNVANAQSLVANNPTATAFSNLAAPQVFPNSFIWGAPFFFGRNVFTAFEGANAAGVPGPYFAF